MSRTRYCYRDDKSLCGSPHRSPSGDSSRLRVPPAQGPVRADRIHCVSGALCIRVSQKGSADSLPSGKSDGDMGSFPISLRRPILGRALLRHSQIVLIYMSPKNNTARVGGYYA